MTWRPSKSPGECSGINRRDTVSCFVIHKYGNGKQRLLVVEDPCASSQVTQSQRVHTKERRTTNSLSTRLARFVTVTLAPRVIHRGRGAGEMSELFWQDPSFLMFLKFL